VRRSTKLWGLGRAKWEGYQAGGFDLARNWVENGEGKPTLRCWEKGSKGGEKKKKGTVKASLEGEGGGQGGTKEKTAYR